MILMPTLSSIKMKFTATDIIILNQFSELFDDIQTWTSDRS